MIMIENYDFTENTHFVLLRIGQIKTVKERSEYFGTGRERSGLDRSRQVRAGLIGSGQVGTGKVKLGEDRLGLVCSCQNR